MKALKIIGIALVAVIAVVVVAGLMTPNSYEVSRSITIDAGTDAVHHYVGDLNQWDTWSPWKDADPTIAVTIGEQATGVGASQSWIGDSGSGSLTFTEASPAEGIAFYLHIEKGAPATGALRYEPDGEGTKVTWSMQGSIPVPVMGGFIAKSMDGMVGPMFDNGLQKLKKAVEATPAPPVEDQEAQP